jgi:hypothetical protein
MRLHSLLPVLDPVLDQTLTVLLLAVSDLSGLNSLGPSEILARRAGL